MSDSPHSICFTCTGFTAVSTSLRSYTYKRRERGREREREGKRERGMDRDLVSRVFIIIMIMMIIIIMMIMPIVYHTNTNNLASRLQRHRGVGAKPQEGGGPVGHLGASNMI